MIPSSRIFVAGHGGLVGSAILRELSAQGFTNLLTPSRRTVDLTIQSQVDAFFNQYQPEYVFMGAARVGGILANETYPADFILDNLQIQNNIFAASKRTMVKKLLFLGSSCIYPRSCPQPMKEEYLLTGPLESTNEPYAVAKIAGLKTCSAMNRQYGTDFLCVMPTNLYGPNDNFDPNLSHVLPALLRKFHRAKTQSESSVVLWGTGQAKREFLHVDDLAKAVVFLMRNYHAKDIGEFVNVGTGTDTTVHDLAKLVQAIIGYEGDIQFDPLKPDGTPRKLLDISKLFSLGWKASIPLAEGIRSTYEWALSHGALTLK